MAKLVTPVIGLAVVVALAMVAVFGAMSLTNPAFAAVGGPTDAELAERTFSPQDAPDDFEATGDHSAVMLAWDSETSAMGWNLEVKRDGDTESWQFFETVAETRTQQVGPYTFTVPDGGDVNEIDDGSVTGLTNGTEYCFRLQYTTGAGDTLSLSDVSEDCATPMRRPDQADDLEADPGDGQVTLEWDEPGDDNIDKWQVLVLEEVPDPADVPALNAMSDWKDIPNSDDGTDEYTVTGLQGSKEYWFAVRAVNGETKSNPVTSKANDDNYFITAMTTGTGIGPGEPSDHTAISVEATGMDPGENPRYTLEFTSGKSLSTGTDSFTVKMEDFGVPSSIDESDITMRITAGLSTCIAALNVDGECPASATAEERMGFPLADQSAHPETVTVDGSKIILTVPDFGDDADGDQGILKGDTVTVIIGQDAGITNPTEGGKSTPGKAYPWEVDGTASDDDDSVMVPIVIGIDADDNEAGRGDTVTLTGAGYKNGTTLTFWRDANGNGVKDGGEAELCDADVGSDDTASCSFDVNKPPFAPGTYGSGDNDGCGAFTDDDEDMTGSLVQNCNLINGVDGRDNTVTVSRDEDDIMDNDGDIEDYAINLVPSLSASPTTANPGETVLLQLRDFESGSVTAVEVAGEPVDGFSAQAIPNSGDHNFSIIIPNDVPEGKQALRIFVDGDGSERVTMTIGGPVMRATPSDVVPNQRISLVGTGFSRDADELESITIGGEMIPNSRINDGDGVDSVSVDSGGNWSTSLDLPLTSATTAEGSREIRVRDNVGREGTILVNFPARKITITPESGRVGTLATVRGEGFPGKNDDGSSYNIQIVYDASGGRETTVSASADAGGTFEVQLRVPTSASIPSTNTVKVLFSDDNDINVVTTVTHAVPEGTISLDTTSGPRGTTVAVTGEGFKTFVPVSSVKVGAIEVTPSPRPSTDDQGMMTFEITIPGLDNGIQTIEVKVGNTTASKGFTVTPSGVSDGDITEASLAIVNLGDNFVRSFNFNNDTKSWTFYSPEAPDDSTQTNFITGESYWILIGESQEVILNGKTRNLTCAAGSCWNQIVW